MRQFLIKLPFNGCVQTEVLNVNGILMNQYKQYEIVLNDSLKIVNELELDELYSKYRLSLITKPVEISEGQFYHMLEVLPPCRWSHVGGREFFHVSERYIDDLVHWYFKDGDKFYEFINSFKLTNSDLVNVWNL